MTDNNSAHKKKSFLRHYIGVISLSVVYLLCLILPSGLFVETKLWGAETLFVDNGIERYDFPQSFYKLSEVLTWCTVCGTSLFIIFINTFTYAISFGWEMMDENHYRVKKGYFITIFVLFLVWFVGTLVSSWAYFYSDYTDFKEIISSTRSYSEIVVDRKTISTDRQFSSDISVVFGHFIHHVERFTIGTIVLFILIDVLSLIVKNQQIKNTAGQSETVAVKLLAPQRTFIFNQLFMIDIPVIIGILLISFFVWLIPTDKDIIFDSKYVFIAGGIGMHLIISQLIFLILNFKYKHEERKIESRA
jgi:hypothetical protein